MENNKKTNTEIEELKEQVTAVIDGISQMQEQLVDTEGQVSGFGNQFSVIGEVIASKLDKTSFEDYIQANNNVLWINPNPDVNFEEQTITLASDDYDYLEIITRSNYSDSPRTEYIVFFEKGRSGVVNVGYNNFSSNGTAVGSYNTMFTTRYWSCVDNTHYKISIGCYVHNLTWAKRNDLCIPYKVIAHKRSM